MDSQLRYSDFKYVDGKPKASPNPLHETCRSNVVLWLHLQLNLYILAGPSPPFVYHSISKIAHATDAAQHQVYVHAQGRGSVDLYLTDLQLDLHSHHEVRAAASTAVPPRTIPVATDKAGLQASVNEVLAAVEEMLAQAALLGQQAD